MTNIYQKPIRIIFLSILICAFVRVSGQRYLEEVFDQVTVTSNVTYGVNATVLLYPLLGEAVPQLLTMDIYEPTGDIEAERPLMLYFHTGNFLPHPENQSPSGLKTDSATVEICSRFARMGYVVASCTYRLGWNPIAGTQEERVNTLINAIYRGVQDANTAARYFRRNATEDGNEFAIDTDRIVIWGQGTGGYISLAASTIDAYADLLLPKFTFSNLVPMVVESINGDILGTSFGINILDGDTLCYPNHVGFSSDFNVCVNMGGALGDISWLDAGDGPFISFQTPTDPFAPYQAAVLIVPGFNLPVVEVMGAYLVQEKCDLNGNNASWATSNIDDVWSQAANAVNNEFDGLYPFIRPNGQLVDSAPWEWWAPNNPNNASGLLTNSDMSAAKGRTFIDTIQGYSATRLACSLALPNNPCACDSGCTNPAACNFNPNADCDDSSCTFPGCNDPSACTYDAQAGCNDGSCLYNDPCGICGGSSITGCTNPAACNYAPDAACDDGSCSFPGCTNEGSVNFNPLAGCDDGSCIPTFGSFEINAPASMLYSDTLEIEVVVTGGQNLYGLFATLNYNAQRFAFVGSTLGDYLGTQLLASPPVDAGGSIEFGASKLGQQPGTNGDGWFYTLRFVPISPNLGNPVFVDFSLTASDAFNALGTSGQLFLPETHTVELIFEAEVWPGDLNHDGVVSVADILPIGYFYNITGPARPNASLAWEGQNCPIWGTGASFPGDGFYRVFADGNGDGVINLADQVAVGFNINQTVSLDLLMPNLEMLATTQSTGVVVPIANAVSPDQISIPETESITALFTATTAAGNAESLFGFTMSIDFSSLGILASEVEVNFSVSEFGVLNQTMIAQAYDQGSQLDLAITRTTPNTTVGEITLFAVTLPLPAMLSAGDYNLPVTIGSANDPIGQTALLSAQNIQFSVSSPFGCTDNAACNYNPGATLDDGSCLIIGDACDDGNANTINDVITTNCECAGETIGDAVLGCTEADACNYNPQATQDDGSCEYVDLYAINGQVGPSAFSTVPYSYTSTVGSTYIWAVTNGVLASGQGTSEVEVIWSSQGSGSVSVTETDIDDCTGATVTQDVVVLPTNIAELTPQSISIYPNPAQTWFRVDLPENFVGARIELFALTGQLLGSTQLIARSQQVDVSHLTNGMYLVHVYLPSGRSVQRLSVAR